MAPLFAVVSPHTDDGVLSCAELLTAHPGSVTVTVFAGGPSSVDPLPRWDRKCGFFKAGDNVMKLRREEDSAAIAELGGRAAVHLPFWDAQYRVPRRYGYAGARGLELADDIADQLQEAISQMAVDTVVVPLGLGHEDHILTTAACLKLAQTLVNLEWWIYEELPYRMKHPRDLRAATLHLHDLGFKLCDTGITIQRDPARKRHAIEHHRSQLTPLGVGVDIAIEGPETYHVLR